LDPAIREQAFELIKGYITAERDGAAPSGSKVTRHKKTALGSDPEAFFAQYNNGKPSENTRLIAAFFYREYGPVAFSISDVRRMASETGLAVPERMDMSLKTARAGGKSLFQAAGRGRYRPTVHGEAYMRDTYHVSRGIKKKAG
jgi:hypothetical protein